MRPRTKDLTPSILRLARHSLQAHHLPRIVQCLGTLRENQIWWRANPASNSIGNLVLHLQGNVRQWILSGLGQAPDRRERDKEFAERGPVRPSALLATLGETVDEACRVISRQSWRDLALPRVIQGFRVTGLQALTHVTEHFAYHTGQIIYATKIQLARDLHFTRLPPEKPRQGRRKNLPAL